MGFFRLLYSVVMLHLDIVPLELRYRYLLNLGTLVSIMEKEETVRKNNKDYIILTALCLSA